VSLRLASVLFMALFALNAHALDNRIKVLAVMAPNAVNDANLSVQLNQLETVWNGSSIPTVTVLSLVNQRDGAGNPIKPQLSGPPLVTTNFKDTHTALLSGAYNLGALRNSFQADLLVVFVPGTALSGVCGYAPQDNWTDGGTTPGAYIPAVSGSTVGLDLRGSDKFFLAILSTSPACTQIQSNNNNTNNVAHEIGHLFGAGHDTAQTPAPFPAASPPGYYLFTDSHAMVQSISIFGFTLVLKSAIARPDLLIQDCISSPAGNCIASSVYSRDGGFGNGSHDNVKALAFTANSIANYRPIPANCNLSKPTNVFGFVTHVCFFNTGLTRHQVFWDDACPDASDYYEVQRSLVSAFGPYAFGWTTTTQNTPIYNNIDGWVRIRACNNSSGCSSPSDSVYFAPALCIFL